MAAPWFPLNNNTLQKDFIDYKYILHGITDSEISALTEK